MKYIGGYMKKKRNFIIEITLAAESEGFKPPVRTSRTADFESAPIDHSGNFPNAFFLERGAKLGFYFYMPK